MNKLKAVVTLILVLSVVLFALQNAEVVEMNFLVWSFAIPRVLMFFTLLVVGFIVGLIVSSFSSLKSDKSQNQV